MTEKHGTAQRRSQGWLPLEEKILRGPHRGRESKLGGLVAGGSKLGGRQISSGSMAQSAANGGDQDLASKRLHSRMEASCLELALEGERLCKAGDFKGGTAFFEAAVQVGTEDLKTLSAIYSQLGNAYFYLKEYGKALEYHKHDLTLAR